MYPSTTWELITSGKYIKSGSTALQTGGSNSVNILKENLPNVKLKVDSFSLTTQPHTHTYKRPIGKPNAKGDIWAGSNDDAAIIIENTSSAGGQNTGTASPSTESLGSGTALSIQPAYITLKFWKRLT